MIVFSIAWLFLIFGARSRMCRTVGLRPGTQAMPEVRSHTYHAIRLILQKRLCKFFANVIFYRHFHSLTLPCTGEAVS